MTALAHLSPELRRRFVGRLRAGGAAHVVWMARTGDLEARAFMVAVVDDARQGHARARDLAAELVAAQHELVVSGGFDLFRSIGDAAKDVGHVADEVVKPLGGWSGVLSDIQGVASVIPGIGTGISAAIGAAAAVIGGGGPLVIALKTAYGAIPIPPGVRQITDSALDAIIALIKGGNITDAALAVIRDRLPEGIARQAFDTLAHVVEGAASKGKAPPIKPAPAQLHQHYVTQYTKGLGAAVAHGMAHTVPPAAAATLANVPTAHLAAGDAATLQARHEARARLPPRPAPPRRAVPATQIPPPGPAPAAA
jgi:hypothetical protein